MNLGRKSFAAGVFVMAYAHAGGASAAAPNSERQGAFGFTFTSSNTKRLTSTSMPAAIDTTKFDTSTYNVQSFGLNSNASTYFSGAMTNPP